MIDILVITVMFTCRFHLKKSYSFYMSIFHAKLHLYYTVENVKTYSDMKEMVPKIQLNFLTMHNFGNF